MNRPYVICHMTISIDGKVTGEHLVRPNAAAATEFYYEINRAVQADGYACGRVTMEGSFTGGWYPDLSAYEPIDDTLCSIDYVTGERSGFYAVAFDPHGRLGWKYNHIIDPDHDPGYDNAQIIEVLTENVDARYLSYLRSMGILYLFAGKTEIDIKLALQKLNKLIGIKRLLLEGGSILNGAFQRAGVVDELSLVVDPVIAGKNGKPLFTDSMMEDYKLADVRKVDDVLWMSYKALIN